ncbi:MAG: hypothetical protein M1820_006078 [Bogoriella megaspora]|nr:MAG: hypothetical protein M1820_006078 [Bogoriella megaspora]
MSNPPSNRWREGRPQSLNAPPPQQRQQLSPQPKSTERSKDNTSPRPAQTHNKTPSQAQAGNVWGDKGGSRAAVVSPPSQAEEKVLKTPAVEFNTDEVKAFLKRDVASGDGADAKKAASSTTKANIMGNGQDFWTQLRRQVTDLEQNKR